MKIPRKLRHPELLDRNTRQLAAFALCAIKTVPTGKRYNTIQNSVKQSNIDVLKRRVSEGVDAAFNRAKTDPVYLWNCAKLMYYYANIADMIDDYDNGLLMWLMEVSAFVVDLRSIECQNDARNVVNHKRFFR